MTIAVNRSVSPDDRERLSEQCERLLSRLRRGAATNVELMTELRILNLSARASECRQAGWITDVAKVPRERGVYSYSLRGRVVDGQLSLVGV